MKKGRRSRKLGRSCERWAPAAAYVYITVVRRFGGKERKGNAYCARHIR